MLLQINPPAVGIKYDYPGGAIVTDYSWEAAQCTECGLEISHGLLETNPTILDDWEDCGDEVYCPKCRAPLLCNACGNESSEFDGLCLACYNARNRDWRL